MCGWSSWHEVLAFMFIFGCIFLSPLMQISGLGSNPTVQAPKLPKSQYRPLTWEKAGHLAFRLWLILSWGWGRGRVITANTPHFRHVVGKCLYLCPLCPKTRNGFHRIVYSLTQAPWGQSREKAGKNRILSTARMGAKLCPRSDVSPRSGWEQSLSSVHRGPRLSLPL